MSIRRLALLLFATLVGALALTPVHAQTIDAESALNDAIEEIDAARVAFDIPGMAIAIAMDGKVVIARGLGRRGLDDPAPVDADTRFAIGSCTKAFTSFGVGLLVDDGRLQFGDRVRAYDPLLALPQSGALDKLTVAALLSQRSGLARHDFLWHARPGMTRADFAAAQAMLAMQGAPGARFGYTNSALILAGRVIDLRSGLTWENFTTQRIFAPLGMTRSNFSSGGLGADSNAARATKRADGASRTVAWRDARLLGPAGAINSTAHDMGRWLLVLSGDGAIEGRRVIAPATLQTLWTPVSGAAPPRRSGNDDEAGGYAMGWRVDSWRGVRRISHSGAVDGFRARVTLFPDRGIGIAVMANLGPTQLPDFATRFLAERLLDLPRLIDLGELALDRRSDEVAALTRPAPLPRGRVARLQAQDPSVPARAPRAALQGVYAHPAYGDIRIEAAPDAQALRIAFGTLGGRLDHWRGDSFISFSDRPDDTLDEGEIVFRYDSSGAVAGLTAMIDNDIAPIPFTRRGDLPPPSAAALPAAAKLTGYRDAGPGAADTLDAATTFVLLFGAIAALGAIGSIAMRRRRASGEA